MGFRFPLLVVLLLPLFGLGCSCSQTDGQGNGSPNGDTVSKPTTEPDNPLPPDKVSDSEPPPVKSRVSEESVEFDP